MMPSPLTHQPRDARHSGWLSASTALAYCRSTNRPAVAAPTLSATPTVLVPARHPHPPRTERDWGRLDATSSNLMPRAKSP